MQFFNKGTLDTLLLLSGSAPQPLLNMLNNMVSSHPANIEELHHCLQRQDFRTADQLLHKIRGGFATLGAERLAAGCATMEKQLQQHQLPTDETLTAFITLYQDTCTELQQFIEQRQLLLNNAGTQTTDLQLLLKLLQQHDMSACDVAAASTVQLSELLTPAVSARFFHQLALLDFAAAASILSGSLTDIPLAKRKSDR